MIVAMGRPRQETVAALDMRRKQNTFNSFLFLCHASPTPRWSNRSRRRWQFFIPRLADMHVHTNRTGEPAAPPVRRGHSQHEKNLLRCFERPTAGSRRPRCAFAEHRARRRTDPRLRKGPGPSENERRGFAWRVEERHGHDLSGNGFARGFHR